MIPSDTLLVIPTCRDGDRLVGFLPELCAELAQGPGGVQLQIVDDGSSAREQMGLAKEIDRMRCEHPFLQPLLVQPENHGKGHAIRVGWAALPNMRWLAFADADGAAPAAEVVALLQAARHSASPAIFIAVRTDQPGKVVTRFWHRRIGSRAFNAWVRFSLGLELPDTQCGLKVIPASFFVENEWAENGFAFDLELLMRAREAGLPVITRPIAWHEQAGSSLGVGAMFGLFAAAWRLRKTKIRAKPAIFVAN